MNALLPHADHRPSASFSINADACQKPRTADLVVIELQFVISGDVDAIKFPAPVMPKRVDELWHTTCFEMFLRAGGESYWELNLSPSGEWAGYLFGGYRQDRDDLRMYQPNIQVVPGEGLLGVVAAVMLPAHIVPYWPLDLGLSAVIEEKDGTKSFWALAHPEGAPDFHHPDCFALSLEAGGSP